MRADRSSTTDRTALRLVPAIRLACAEDQRAAAAAGRIPFSTVDPSGLVAMQELLEGLGFDVDEVALGRALNRYLEVSEP